MCLSPSRQILVEATKNVTVSNLELLRTKYEKVKVWDSHLYSQEIIREGCSRYGKVCKGVAKDT